MCAHMCSTDHHTDAGGALILHAWHPGLMWHNTGYDADIIDMAESCWNILFSPNSSLCFLPPDSPNNDVYQPPHSVSIQTHYHVKIGRL